MVLPSHKAVDAAVVGSARAKSIVATLREISENSR